MATQRNPCAGDRGPADVAWVEHPAAPERRRDPGRRRRAKPEPVDSEDAGAGSENCGPELSATVGEHWVARNAPPASRLGTPLSTRSETRRPPTTNAAIPQPACSGPRRGTIIRGTPGPSISPIPTARRACAPAAPNPAGTRVARISRRKLRPRSSTGSVTKPCEPTTPGTLLRPSTDSDTRAGTCTGNAGIVRRSRLSVTGRRTRHSIHGRDPASSSPTHAVELDPSKALDARKRPSLRNRPEESATTGPEYPAIRSSSLSGVSGDTDSHASALQLRAAGAANTRDRPVSPSPASRIDPASQAPCPRIRCSGSSPVVRSNR